MPTNKRFYFPTNLNMEKIKIYVVQYDTKDSSIKYQRVAAKNFEEAFAKAKEISKISIVCIEEENTDAYF